MTFCPTKRSGLVHYRIGVLRTEKGYYFKKRATFAELYKEFVQLDVDAFGVNVSEFLIGGNLGITLMSLRLHRLFMFDAFLEPASRRRWTTCLICTPDGQVGICRYAETDWRKGRPGTTVKAVSQSGGGVITLDTLCRPNSVPSRKPFQRAVLAWPGYFEARYVPDFEDCPVLDSWGDRPLPVMDDSAVLAAIAETAVEAEYDDAIAAAVEVPDTVVEIAAEQLE